MTAIDPGMTGQSNIDQLRLRQKLALSMLGNSPRTNSPVAAGLNGLAQILAARSTGKIGGQIAEAEKQKALFEQEGRAKDMTALGQIFANGTADPSQLGLIQDPRIQELAASYIGKQMAPGKPQIVKDALGRPRNVATGELVFPEAVPEGALPTPREKLDVEQDRIRQGDERIAADREENQRQSRKLSATSEKALDLAQTQALESGRSRFELEALAGDYEALAPDSGTSARWQDSFKSIVGSEDAVSVLRTRYASVRNSEVMKSLPPGVASDKDIELAMQGFLPATAQPQQVSSFLRGLAKMSQFDETFNEFKARYIDENNGIRGLFDAWKGSEELAGLKDMMQSTREQSAPTAQPQEITEGTMIENDAGERLIMRNGQWTPISG